MSLNSLLSEIEFDIQPALNITLSTNDLVECALQTFKKAMRKSNASNKYMYCQVLV